MNEIVWPMDQAEPAHQVVVGFTESDEPPKFMKYGCSIRKGEPKIAEIKGKKQRETVAS